MPELLNLGEKGQVVIPKKYRDKLNLHKGSKLIAEEENGKITIKPIKQDEDYLWMLVGEETLKKTWDNPYDERWDDVL